MTNSATLHDSRLPSFVVWTMFLAVGLFLAQSADAQATGQKTFSSSKEAVEAFVGAIRSGNNADLLAILGPGSEQIISSGDEISDKAERQRFIAKYDSKHSLSESGSHQLTLNIGEDDWPLPTPLVKLNDRWYFDGAAGKDEILYRRIGHNEIAAMGVCKGVVAAEHDYAATAHGPTTKTLETARRIHRDGGCGSNQTWPRIGCGSDQPDWMFFMVVNLSRKHC